MQDIDVIMIMPYEKWRRYDIVKSSMDAVTHADKWHWTNDYPPTNTLATIVL